MLQHNGIRKARMLSFFRDDFGNEHDHSYATIPAIYIKCGIIIVSTVIVGTEEVGVEVAEKMESSEACDDDVWRMYSNVIRYVMRYQRIHTIIHLLINCVRRRNGRKKLAFIICLWVLSNRKVY